jgi:hypothetical protein
VNVNAAGMVRHGAMTGMCLFQSARQQLLLCCANSACFVLWRRWQHGIAPLYAAAANGFAECVQALVEGGAEKEVLTEVREVTQSARA